MYNTLDMAHKNRKSSIKVKLWQMLLSNPGYFHKNFWKIVKNNIFYEMASLYVNHSCNLQCSHCFWGMNKTLEQNLSLEQWKNILQQFIETGTTHFHICGKEPFTSPHKLFGILSFITNFDGIDSSIITNGLFIKKCSKELLRFPPNKITLSIDGPKKFHENLRGANTFDTVMRNVDFVLSSKLCDLSVVSIVNKRNRTSIQPFVRSMINKGIKTCFIQPELPYGRRLETVEDLISCEDMDYIINSTIREIRSKKINLEHTIGFLIPPTFTAYLIKKNETVKSSINSFLSGESKRPEAKIKNTTVYFRVHPYCTASWAECRVTADGFFLGCDVVMGSPDYRKYSEGNFKVETLKEIKQTIASNNCKIYNVTKNTPRVCLGCEDFKWCGSGCRTALKVAGLSSQRADMYCQR